MSQPSSINCVHFGPCSGCTLDADWATPPIHRELELLWGAPVPLIAGTCRGWRHRAKLAVRDSIGLFKRGTHDVLAIPHCQVHHPALNRAVASLPRLPPYNEATHTGLLRYIQLQVSRITGETQLTLVLNAQEPIPFSFPGSVWLNFQPHRTNTIFGPTWHHLSGPPLLPQQIGRATVQLHPGAFCQAHLPLFDQLLHDLEAWVPEQSRLLELYAGAGALSLHLAPRLKTAHLIESNPFAAQSFHASSPPAHYTYSEAAVDHTPLPDADITIVDPPRKGIPAPVIPRIPGKRLIYISCQFDSLKRDLALLEQAGWERRQMRAYVLFPGTNQVETVVLLEKNDQNDLTI